MIAEEQIADRLQKLPPSLQREVLDFIEFLAHKAAQDQDEESNWMRFSLARAMSGIEDDGLEYSEADLKEKWQ